VPPSVRDTAPLRHEFTRGEAADQPDAVLSVTGEDRVGVAECARRSDLCGLLAPRHQPELEFALTLKRERLMIEAAGASHVAVELAGKDDIHVPAGTLNGEF